MGGSVVSAGGIGGATQATGGSICDVTVHAPNSIQAAINHSAIPGTVCIAAGLYQENLQLRDGVNIRGTGADAMLCGSIEADAAITWGAELSQLSIFDQVGASSPVHLSLRDLDIATPPPDGCRVQAQGAVRIKRQGAGSLRFSANNVRVGSPGFDLSIVPAGSPLDDEIRITQSRCVSTFQCYDFLRLQLDTQPGEQLALGSRLSVDISNNLVQNIVLEGMTVNFPVVLQSADANQVLVKIHHNTLISQGPFNNDYGILFWLKPGVPIVVANNAIAFFTQPLNYGDSPQLLQVANMLSSDASSKSWFENFDAGNFLPSVGSPLLAAGDATYGTPTDIDGKPRVGQYDIGAYQR